MSDFFMDHKPAERKEFELVPEGKHPAIIKYIVDLGLQPDTDFTTGAPIQKHQIYVGWQFPGLKDSQGNTHWKGDTFKVTDFKSGKGFMFHENSKLSKFLRSWTGGSANDVKWYDFLLTLATKEEPCYITIGHSQSKDGTKTYSNIESIKPYNGKDAVVLEGGVIRSSWKQAGTDAFNALPGTIKRKAEGCVQLQDQAPTAAGSEDIPF